MQRMGVVSTAAAALVGILLLAGCSSFGTLDPRGAESSAPTTTRSAQPDSDAEDRETELPGTGVIPATFPDEKLEAAGFSIESSGTGSAGSFAVMLDSDCQINLASADHPDNGPSVGYTVIRLD